MSLAPGPRAKGSRPFPRGRRSDFGSLTEAPGHPTSTEEEGRTRWGNDVEEIDADGDDEVLERIAAIDAARA